MSQNVCERWNDCVETSVLQKGRLGGSLRKENPGGLKGAFGWVKKKITVI